MYKNKTVAAVIPAFNEEQNIGQVIEAIPDFIDHVMVIDDGSSDNTSKIAKECHAIVLKHSQNRGVGAAFSTGLQKALNLRVDVMVNIDADGQFNPKDIEKLILPIIENNAEFVTASRFIDKEFYPKMPKIKFWGNKFMSSFISKIAGQKFYDVSCGFRAYSKEAMFRLNLFGNFTYTQETFLDFAFKNIRIVEIPIHVRGTRKYGQSKVASNLFAYAYKTLKIILRSFRDYKPFRLTRIPAILFLTISILVGLFLLIHYILTSTFSPHKWAGFTSGFFMVLSLILFGLGFILDMFARMRHNQEEMLYFLKKNFYKNLHKN